MHIKQAIMQTPMRPAVAALVRLLLGMVVGCLFNPPSDVAAYIQSRWFLRRLYLDRRVLGEREEGGLITHFLRSVFPQHLHRPKYST